MRVSVLVWPRFRTVCEVVVPVLLTTTFLTGVSPAGADDTVATPVVGSFAVGQGMAGEIDAQTGKFTTQVSVANLGGSPSRVQTSENKPPTVDSLGSFNLGISYHHDSPEGTDRYGLSSAWTWNLTHIDGDGGLRVFSALGGMFEADASQPSGLAEYTLEDLVFRQEPGVLPSREEGEAGEPVPYAYTIFYRGGLREYFNMVGDLVARVGMQGERVDLIWEPDHRLMAVVDASSSRLDVVWTETGVEVISPVRSDGVTPKTVLAISGNRLTSLTNPVDEHIVFEYEDTGRVKKIISDIGAVTEVSYQQLPDNNTAVDRLRVIDASSGEEMLTRHWMIQGEHSSSGWPAYSNQSQLWESGDNEYRYDTILSDDVTNMVSEYNSQGLLVSRDLIMSTSHGDMTAQTEHFTFPGTENNGVPNPQTLPKQYEKPTQTSVVFYDNAGGARRVVENSEYTVSGQVSNHVGKDGAITHIVYDNYVPEGMVLPIGLPLETITTGLDGIISKTVNVLTPDHKNVHMTETFVNSSDALNTFISTSRKEMIVESDGFVSEERLVANKKATGGPDSVVTRFSRHSDAQDDKKVILSQTNAVGTSAESTVSTVVDKPTGLIVADVDPTGRKAETTYDAAGRMLTHTDAAGLTTKTTYDNTVTRVTQPTGVTHSEYVDILGRVVKNTDNIYASSDSSTAIPTAGCERVIETRKYENNNSRITVRDAYGQETVTVRDVFGRIVSVTASNGMKQLTEYDDVANTVKTGTVASNETLENARFLSTTQRDNSGRVVSESALRSDGVLVPEKTTTFDGVGRISEQVDADLSTASVWNPDGTPKTTTITPVKQELFPGKTTIAQREHNIFGTSTHKTLTQSDGETQQGVSRVLDSVGRTVSQTDQAGGTTHYTYTLDGLKERVFDEKTGVLTNNTYDQKTRALFETQTQAADGSVSQKRFEYEPYTGKLISVFDPSNRENTQITYAYDVFGNLIHTRYPDGKTITHTFDKYGRETGRIDIQGNITQYNYNKAGLLHKVTQTNPENLVLASIGYEYDALGRVVKLNRDNNVTTQYTFTSTDRIATEKTTHEGATIFDASYVYDTHGNLTTKRETRPDQHNTERLATETTTYAYDAYNRLIASSVYNGTEPSADPRQHTDYEISVSGDVTKETVRGNEDATKTVRQFEYNPLGHLLAITTNVNDGTTTRAEQSYDAAGNLTSTAEGIQYTYNVYNQPVTETHPTGTTVHKTYWSNGKLSSSTTTGKEEASTEKVTLYWEGDTLVNDTYTSDETAANSERGPVTASYLIDNSRHTRNLTFQENRDNTQGPVKAQLHTGTEYYVTDRHGNTAAMTAKTGQIATSYTYSDYGVVTVHPSENNKSQSVHRNPFQYAGEYTFETGTQLLGVRSYEPSHMRFTTKDTAELYNLYAYGNNNPITMVDPTGQSTLHDFLDNGGSGLLGAAWMILLGGGVMAKKILGASIGIFGMGVAAGANIIIGSVLLAAYNGAFSLPEDWLKTSTALSITTDVITGIGTIFFLSVPTVLNLTLPEALDIMHNDRQILVRLMEADVVNDSEAIPEEAFKEFAQKEKALKPISGEYSLHSQIVDHPDYNAASVFITDEWRIWQNLAVANVDPEFARPALPTDILRIIANLHNESVAELRTTILQSTWRPFSLGSAMDDLAFTAKAPKIQKFAPSSSSSEASAFD